jgi:hypothetical protein
MKIRFLLVIGLVLWSLSSVAQMDPFLLLEKPGKQKSRVRYYPGDEIYWKFKEDKITYNAVIAVISDSSFTTDQALIVPYSEVDVVLIPKGGGLKAVGINAFWAIPPMIVLSAANNAFNTGRSPLVDEEVWYISAVFASISGIFFLLPDEKSRRLENKWRIIPIIH